MSTECRAGCLALARAASKAAANPRRMGGVSPVFRARPLAVVAVVCTLGSAWPSTSRAQTADPDPWFGKDKALHFSISAGIAGVLYAGAATQFEARYPPLLLAGGATLAIGAGKELYDLSGHGDPSWKDFTWDVIGTFVGLGLAWGIDLLVRGVSDAHPLFGSPRATGASGASSATTASGIVLVF